MSKNRFQQQPTAQKMTATLMAWQKNEDYPVRIGKVCARDMSFLKRKTCEVFDDLDATPKERKKIKKFVLYVSVVRGDESEIFDVRASSLAQLRKDFMQQIRNWEEKTRVHEPPDFNLGYAQGMLEPLHEGSW